MPGGDGTGPMGTGTMTGWGRGFCGEQHATGAERGGRGVWGGGFGRRGGGGGGRRNRFWATGARGWMPGPGASPTPADAAPTPEGELQWLIQRAAALESEQEQISARLSELNQESGDQG